MKIKLNRLREIKDIFEEDYEKIMKKGPGQVGKNAQNKNGHYYSYFGGAESHISLKISLVVVETNFYVEGPKFRIHNIIGIAIEIPDFRIIIIQMLRVTFSNQLRIPGISIHLI